MAYLLRETNLQKRAGPFLWKARIEAPNIRLELLFLNQRNPWKAEALSLQHPDKISFVCGSGGVKNSQYNPAVKPYRKSLLFDPNNRFWRISSFASGSGLLEISFPQPDLQNAGLFFKEALFLCIFPRR